MERDRFVLLAARKVIDDIEKEFGYRLGIDDILEIVELIPKYLRRAVDNRDDFRIPYICNFEMKWNKFRNGNFEDVMLQYMTQDEIQASIRNGTQREMMARVGIDEYEMERLGFGENVKLGWQAWNSASKWKECSKEEIDLVAKELHMEAQDFVRIQEEDDVQDS